MKKLSKYILILFFTVLSINFISMNNVSAHSLEPWSKIYTQENAGGDHQFAIDYSYHIDGDTVNYYWENSTVKNIFSVAFADGVRRWNGLISAKETDKSQAHIVIKYNPNDTVANRLAYVYMYPGNGHYSSTGKTTEMVLTGVYKCDATEKGQVIAHELAHVWGILDLYTVGKDNLDSIMGRHERFNSATRHDMNAMRICLNKPWFDTGNGFMYQKSPGVWANNEWLNIDGKDCYFKGKIKYAAYKINYNANGGSSAPSFQTKIHNENLTLSSQKPTKNYKITYNANGGSISQSGKNVSATFNNWNTNISGNGTKYSPGAVFTENVSRTMYAQWINPVAGSFPTVSKSYSIFKGWFTSKSGGTKVSENTKVTGNVTYYAHWKLSSILRTDTTSRAIISEGGDTAYFRFTPTTDGAYKFTSVGDKDTNARLFTDNTLKCELAFDDDGGDNRNFSIVYWLKAGKTYYFETKLYNAGESGYFDVNIRPYSGTGYNVTYNGSASNASGVPGRDVKVPETPLVLTFDEPIRSEYAFLGWDTNKNVKDPAYYIVKGRYNKKYTENKAVTMYAIWGLRGDVNRDGKLSIADVSLAQKFALNIEKPTVFQEKIADYNCDGKINMTDVTLIQKKALNIE